MPAAGALTWAAAVGAVIALAGVGMLVRRVARLEAALRRRPAPLASPPPPRAIQQVGLVRFQAYHDVGGDYSFALALLDEQGDGVVLDCLYHRERCRVYAKPVRAYGSAIQLTEEEEEAIARARSGEAAAEPTGIDMAGGSA